MPITTMGKTNNDWGVCGFTSSLYSLYTHSPSVKHGALEKGADSYVRMAAEIKSYLVTLQAEGQSKLLQEIQSFTQSFEGYEGFAITEYIERVNAIPKKAGPIGDFSIALTPDAVVDYLRRICGFRNAKLVGPDSGKTELILGVKDNSGMKKYGGLCHYLYQNKPKIHSWGQVFDSVTDADANYSVVWEISPAG